MKTYSMFHTLKDLEKSLCDLYKKYGETFRNKDKEAANIFFGLSNEEFNHSDIIEYMRVAFTNDPVNFKELDVNLTEVERALEEVRNALLLEKPVGLEAAVRFALDLELRLSEQYNIFAVAESNPKYQKFVQISLETQEHFKKLHAFAWSRGYGKERSH
ncbi:MAG TPA: hypothetical protein VGK71_06250 [Nitrospirota bacterium]